MDLGDTGPSGRWRRPVRPRAVRPDHRAGRLDAVGGRAGLDHLHHRARSAAPEALWSDIAGLADRLAARRPGSLAVRALNDALSQPPPPLPAACRLVAKLLADAAEECRITVLIGLDDADRWGPDTGAALTHLLGPAGRCLPLLLIATALPGMELVDQPYRHDLGPLDVADLLAEPELKLD